MLRRIIGANQSGLLVLGSPVIGSSQVEGLPDIIKNPLHPLFFHYSPRRFLDIWFMITRREQGFVISMQPEARAIRFCELSPTRWAFFFGLWGIITECVSTDIPYNTKETGLVLGCAVGDVTSNEATVWIKGIGSQALAVQYGPKRSPDSMVETSFVSPAADSDFTVKINLTGLTAKTLICVPGSGERKAARAALSVCDRAKFR